MNPLETYLKEPTEKQRLFLQNGCPYDPATWLAV